MTKTNVAVFPEQLKKGDVVVEIKGLMVVVERKVEPRPLPKEIGSVIGYRSNIDWDQNVSYRRNFLNIATRIGEDSWIDGESGEFDDKYLLSEIASNSLTGDWFPITLNEDI